MSNYVQHMRWRGLAEGSIESRLSVLRRCQAAIGKPIREATTDDLLAWLDSKRVAPRTRYAYISHLAAFYRWALLEGQIECDPTLRIPRPKMKLGVPRPIGTDDVLFAIGNAPNATVRAMLVLAAYAGLRCMEIANLDGADVLESVEPPAVVVENGKGNKARVVPVGPFVIRSLRATGFRPYGPVFRRESGQPYPAWKVSQIIRTHLHDCGIRASAHQLRHTFATQVLRESGGDLRMTQELLGHSSPTTTSIYAAWAQDRAADVVARLYVSS